MGVVTDISWLIADDRTLESAKEWIDCFSGNHRKRVYDDEIPRATQEQIISMQNRQFLNHRDKAKAILLQVD